MDETTLEHYNGSLERCVARPGFLERLYEVFIAASPEVREKFKDTDLRKQVRAVKKSLYALTLGALGSEEAREEIARLGRIHGREGFKIGPHLYDLWLQCLLQVVREHDVAWSPAVEDSWRRVLEPSLVALKRFS